MHLGRFHYVVWHLHLYFDDGRILSGIDALANTLQTYVNSPNQDTAAAYRASIDAFRKEVGSKFLLRKRVSFQQILEELKASDYIGEALISKVLTIAKDSGYTPSENLQNLTRFRQELNNFIENISNLASGLDELRVEYDQLTEDELEVGLLLPREAVGNSLADLVSEFQHTDRLFRAINEFRGESATSVEVRTIAASWWELFLSVDPITLSAVVVGIERIVELYKKNLEIKKLRLEIEKHAPTPEILNGMDQMVEERIKAGIAELAAELREKLCQIDDKARANELEIQLKIELLHLAKRINQGARYEVRAGLPKKPRPLSEEEKAEPEKLKAYEEAFAVYTKKYEIATNINIQCENFTVKLDSIGAMESPLLINYEEATKEETKP